MFCQMENSPVSWSQCLKLRSSLTSPHSNTALMTSDSSDPETAAASLVYVWSVNHLFTTCKESFPAGTAVWRSGAVIREC